MKILCGTTDTHKAERFELENQYFSSYQIKVWKPVSWQHCNIHNIITYTISIPSTADILSRVSGIDDVDNDDVHMLSPRNLH